MDLLNNFSFILNNARVSLAFVFFDINKELNTSILSSKELEIYSKFLSKKRQHEFISGRLACKKAFFKLIDKSNNINFDYDNSSFSSISVLNSKTGAPFIENSELCVSISHSHGIAIAAISQNAIGIDIEKINPKKISALQYMNPLIDTQGQDANTLTVLWSLKEALSKTLKTGITKDFQFYDTKNFEYINGIYRCDFQNVPECSGVALSDNQYVVALVLNKLLLHI